MPQLVVLHLTDSFVLTRPSLYVSALLLALRTMLQLDLPHLNVLTKIDKLASYDPLPFNLEFYADVHDLHYLVPHLAAEQRPLGNGDTTKTNNGNASSSAGDHFTGLNNAVVELVESFGLVGFELLAVEDRHSMMTLLRAIDRAGGYVFGAAEGANDTIWQVAMRDDAVTMDVRDVQERWIDRREDLDELERRKWEEEGNALRGGQANTDGPAEMERASGIKIVRKK